MRRVFTVILILLAVTCQGQWFSSFFGLKGGGKGNSPNAIPTIVIDSTKSNSGRIVTNDTIYTTDTINFYISATDSDGSIDRVVDTYGSEDTASPFVFDLGYQGSGSQFSVTFTAIDNKEAAADTTASFYLVDTTNTIESGATIDSVEAEQYTIQSTGALRTGDKWSNDTGVTVNSSATHYDIINLDVDSIDLLIEGAVATATFQIEVNGVSKGSATTNPTGLATYSFGNLAATSGDTITLNVTGDYLRHDLSIYYGSGFDCGDPVAPGDGDPCPPPPPPNCPSCSDSIQNCDETGIDCGGSCPPCVTFTQFTVPENELWDYPAGYLHPDSNYIGFAIASGTNSTDTLDNDLFYIENDTLYTKTWFNREDISKYTILLNKDNVSTYRFIDINISDVSGVRDEWRIADAADSIKYATTVKGTPGITMRVGDYIYTGDQGNGSIYEENNNNFGWKNISYPNKVWIGAQQYDKIVLNVDGVSGNDTTEPIYIVPLGGQVRVCRCLGGGGSEGFELVTPLEQEASYIHVTGLEIDSLGIRHPYYPGPGTGLDFSFTHHKWGFFANGDWRWERDVDISGQSHGVRPNGKISHLWISGWEIGDGWFSGLNFKWENNAYVSQGNKVFKNFIRDVATEATYSGSQKGAPQQFFDNMVWENSVFVRSGQAIQHGRMTKNTVIRNCVGYGGFDWKSPFQGSQDGGVQFEGGEDYTIHSCILIGSGKGGTKFGVNKVDPVEDARISGGVLTFRNNLRAWGRGELMFYVDSEHDQKTSILWEDNYFGHWGEGDVTELYPNINTSTTHIVDCRIQPTANYNFTLRGNTYDNTLTDITRNSNVELEDNVSVTSIEAPAFRNALGTAYYNDFADSIVFGDDYDYTRFERYTNLLGSDPDFKVSNTNKNDPAVWEVGDVVQYWNGNRETRFYICIQAESSATNNRPPTSDFDDTNAYWRVLRWVKPDGTYSYYPPDDWRLDVGSFYDLLNMGLQED